MGHLRGCAVPGHQAEVPGARWRPRQRSRRQESPGLHRGPGRGSLSSRAPREPSPSSRSGERAPGPDKRPKVPNGLPRALWGAELSALPFSSNSPPCGGYRRGWGRTKSPGVRATGGPRGELPCSEFVARSLSRHRDVGLAAGPRARGAGACSSVFLYGDRMHLILVHF